jgi:hypothetical protein
MRPREWGLKITQGPRPICQLEYRCKESRTDTLTLQVDVDAHKEKIPMRRVGMKCNGCLKATKQISSSAREERTYKQLGTQCAHPISKCFTPGFRWPPDSHPSNLVLNQGGVHVAESQVSTNYVAEERSKRHSTTAGVVEEESEDGVVSERHDQNTDSLPGTAFRQL